MGSKKAVAAGTLQKGDNIVIDDSAGRALITSVKSTSIRDGLYAPFTPSGKYVVNGKFVVSSFISFENEREGLVVGGMPFSFQWLSHSFEFPHRLVCHYLGQCQGETYDKRSGLSEGWATIPLKFISWVFNLETPTQTGVLSLMVGTFAIFNLIEMVFFQYPLAAVVVLGLMVGVNRGATVKKFFA